MGDQRRASEAALIRTVRSLDQADAETLPNRLERVWDTLSDRRAGSFHAAEEMLLRWLLKNMAGSSANAERLRRYPRVWDILGAVFSLIPLFSLAKSLADRRFVGLVQQTLKDIATPQHEAPQAQANGTDSDVEMPDAPPPQSPANPRKRKRTGSAGFDIALQKQVGGCLQTAEALFEALRILLSRCEVGLLDGPTTHRMGAEHVKSLFSTSATETMEILVPWLTICAVALDRPRVEPFTGQSSWLSTFAALWELHLQSPGDASEVATHLSGTATRLLGKLTGIPRPLPLGVDSVVQERWARDLRRFLARNLILPARAAFLTRGSQEVVRIAVDMARASAPIAFPVLFDLVRKSPLEFGGKASRKDYETWVQTVFDAILHASKNVNRDNSLAAVRSIMEMAANRGAALSAPSLRTVCKGYALRPGLVDWSLLLSLVKLNPDVFLVSEEGKQLLDQVLEKTWEPGSLSAEDFGRAARFIVLLADGYAQARDLSSFVKLWHQHLAPDKPQAGLQPLWAQKELANTVAGLLQSSLNTNQVVELLEWFSSRRAPADSAARIHILEAISAGIYQEEYVDAANMKTFDAVFLDKFSKGESSATSACRWTIASRTIAMATLEESKKIWLEIKSDLKSILRKLPIDREDSLAAFRCCVAAWLANHPGAEHEDEAATLICSFVGKLEKDDAPLELDSANVPSSVSKGTYFSWILSDAPRLLSLFVERTGGIPKGISSLLTTAGAEGAAPLDSALAVSRLLVDRESNVNNTKLMDLLIDTVISLIDTSKGGRSGASTKIAVQFLLDVPAETLSRAQREAAMKFLTSHLPSDSEKPEAIGTEYWNPVLSLMVKLMGRPTFYDGMSFSHLESIGRCLLRTHMRSNRRSRKGLPVDDVSQDRDNLRLLKELAVLTIRQMASGSVEEREKAYFKAAFSALQSPCQDSDVLPRIVLFQALISGIQGSSATKKLEGERLDLGSLKNSLLWIASPVVTSGKWHRKGLLSLLVAVEALGDLDRKSVRQALSDAVPSLVEASGKLLENGVQAGWEVRMFLANHFPEALVSPLKVKLSAEAAAPAVEDGETGSGSSAGVLGKTSLLRYVDAVVRAADEDAKLGYLAESLLEETTGEDAPGQLLVIYRLIQHLKGSQPSASPDRFDLAQAHSMLCQRLLVTSTPSHFVLVSKAIHLLLDQNAACMTQWNIELTLSSVSVISAQASTGSLLSIAPAIYRSLCRLVEVIIKRHRKRLDGHFHILITALQSLLRLLLCQPHDNSKPTSAAAAAAASSSSSLNQGGHDEASRAFPLWERHARLFSRLLTLVCEPTVASVTRSSQKTTTAAAAATAATPGGGLLLDSEKDRAKRYAGQFMYLVLMHYVRLQLEVAAAGVPHGVREALEPGVYSVMDVTTPAGMKMMNDAMDPSGRAIFKEMYKRYQRFGKWTGV